MIRLCKGVFAAAIAVCAAYSAPALAQCTVPNLITNGQVADASEVMDNFTAVAACADDAADAAVEHTGTPQTGAIAVFTGPESVTSGDLSGDVTTSGGTTTSLTSTGVVAGSYANTNITVDAKGRITAAASGSVGSGGSFRGALVYRNADQTGQNYSTHGIISWGAGNSAEVYNTDTIHSLNTNPSRLTVPSGVSKVRLSGNVFLGSVTSSAILILNVFKNGNMYFPGSPYARSQIANPDPAMNLTSAVVPVVAGDYFELGLQITGDTSATFRSSGTWFAMEIVE